MRTAGWVAMVCSGAISLPRRLRAMRMIMPTLKRSNICSPKSTAEDGCATTAMSDTSRRRLYRTVSLMHYTNFFHRPIAEDGFAVDVAARHRAKVAAVIGHGAMVAQHKITVCWNPDFRRGARIQILFRDIKLAK